jgi:drug/metabolite transporter (DMT)-like permease
MAATGIMGVSISMLAFQIGVMNSNASTAAPVVCTNSMFAMLIAHIFTSEKMSKRKWISFVLGIIAIFFMIRPWDMQEGNSILGFSTLILAAVTFGAYTVMGKQTIARIGTFTQTSIGFFFGSAMLLIALLVTGRPVLDGVAEELPVVIYVGVIVTGLGYLVYFLGVHYSDASTGSIAFFVKPAIAPFIAIAALHETIYWNTIVGIGLLLAGSVITIYDTFMHRNEILAGQSAEAPAEEAA